MAQLTVKEWRAKIAMLIAQRQHDTQPVLDVAGGACLSALEKVRLPRQLPHTQGRPPTRLIGEASQTTQTHGLLFRRTAPALSNRTSNTVSTIHDSVKAILS